MRFVAVAILLIVIGSADLQAQHYQCLQPGTKQFFTNDVHYLRGIRIDSFSVSGTSTIFYPYRTPRFIGNTKKVDSNGGSWLGKKVVQLADGTTYFDNIWKDTVFIKTQANLGDSWTFFDDTSAIYYKATVTKVDTESVLGQLDTVKTIQITALAGSTVDSSNKANGLTISLSKNHGFARIFDLFTFPYKVGNRNVNDFFVNYIGWNYQFRQTNYQNPRFLDLFDFAVGDVFEFDCTFSRPSYSIWEINTKSRDSITRVSVTPAGKTYEVRTRTQAKTMLFGGATHVSGAGPYIQTRTVASAERMQILDTLQMPEETGNWFLYYFDLADSTRCTVNALYRRQHFYLVTPLDAPVNENVAYKAGFGVVDSVNGYMWGTGTEQATFVGNMHGTIKSGIYCGGLVPPLKVAGHNVAAALPEFYPNPANGSVHIRYEGLVGTGLTWEVSIVDMKGCSVYHENATSGNLTVNTTEIAEGIYLLQVIAGENAFTEKLNIVH